jgi:hypothetical protein
MAYISARLFGTPVGPGEDLVRFLCAPLGGTLLGLLAAAAATIRHGVWSGERWAGHALAAAYALAALVAVPAVGPAPAVILFGVTALLALLARGDHHPPVAAARATFWDRWLLAVCLGGTLLGLALPLVVDRAPFAPWREGVEARFLRGIPFAEVAGPWRAFVAALGGAIAGKLLLCALLAARPFRERRRWARNAIAASLGVWFFADSLGSALQGAWFNIYLVNLPFGALMLAPLIATWGQFSDQFSVDRAASSPRSGISSSEGSER